MGVGGTKLICGGWFRTLSSSWRNKEFDPGRGGVKVGDGSLDEGASNASKEGLKPKRLSELVSARLEGSVIAARLLESPSASKVLRLSSAIRLVSAISLLSALRFSNHQMAPVESHASLRTLCTI